jgi:dipeptidyl aminopeptidase/acylaminoacyl peptidase
MDKNWLPVCREVEMAELTLRRILVSCAILSVGIIADRVSYAQIDQQKKTYVYKTVGDLQIQADVIRPTDEQVRPVVVWIHGEALIHGTEDTDVPYAQSTLMVEQFERHGVEHRLISVTGAEHGLYGGDPDQIRQAYQQASEFIQTFLAN